MGFHFYADDTQLYLSFYSLYGDDQASSVAQIESCVRDIDRWIACNKVKLKRDKSCLLLVLSTLTTYELALHLQLERI